MFLRAANKNNPEKNRADDRANGKQEESHVRRDETGAARLLGHVPDGLGGGGGEEEGNVHRAPSFTGGMTEVSSSTPTVIFRRCMRYLRA
jgi:hypothetical protein